MKKEDHISDHWDLMLATVEEVATRDNSSVNRLQEEFIEEFGHLPTSELIDYFADLLKKDNEKIRSKRRVQRKSKRSEKPLISKKDPEIEFTDKMAANARVTVLIFRKSFEVTFGKPPPLELVAHFLKRIAYLRRRPSQKNGRLDDDAVKADFVNVFVTGKSPTVLKFRQGFEKKFGAPPDEDMITFFLKKLSEI